MQLPLFLPFYPLHARSLQEGLPLSGGVRLKETYILKVCITDGDVSIWDLIHC